MNKELSLDCIVRFHDVHRIMELKRCIFSLIGQMYRPLNIILVLQRFSVQEIEETRCALEPFFLLPDAPKLTVCNFSHAEPKDARSHLLNMGLEAATGKYLAFLDYDDVLFPEAYSILAGQLQKSDAAIAFASVDLMNAHIYRDFCYVEGNVTQPPFSGNSLLDLFKSNFCPLHSYLIDRQRVSPEQLRFDTKLTIEEDYELLLRICARHKSDFSMISKKIGYYFFKSDGSNTVAVSNQDESRTAEYQYVTALIDYCRKTTCVSFAVQQQLQLQSPREGLTISELLNGTK